MRDTEENHLSGSVPMYGTENWNIEWDGKGVRLVQILHGATRGQVVELTPHDVHDISEAARMSEQNKEDALEVDEDGDDALEVDAAPPVPAPAPPTPAKVVPIKGGKK